ncbi:MAG: ATP-binding protein [Ferruginibacter sp.]
MSYNQKFLLLYLALMLSFSKLIAQQPYFQEENFQSLTSEVNLVNGMVADVNNCIWFSTQTGLYRYDGSRFRHYSVSNTSALKFERMSGIPQITGDEGTNWCIQDGKGNLYRIDSQSCIQPLPLGNGQQLIYSTTLFPYAIYSGTDRVNPQLKEQISEIQLMQKSKRVFLYMVNGDVITMGFREFLNGRTGRLIYNDAPLSSGNHLIATGDNFYLVTNSGLLCWENDAVNPRPAMISGDMQSVNPKINYANIKLFKTSGTNRFLIWYEGDIYEATEDSKTKELDTKLLVRDPGKEIPTTVFYSPAQQIFISYYLNRGLVIYRPKQFSLLSYRPAGLENNREDYYYSVLPADKGLVTISNAGLVWLGNDGSSRILDGEPCNKYYLFKDKAGNIWYQRNKNAQLCYLRADTEQPTAVISLGTEKVFSGMYQQDDTTFFVLTNRSFSKFIFKNKISSLQLLHALGFGADFNVLYAINAQTFWLGSDRGLYQYDVAGNGIKPVKELLNVYVRAIEKLGENNYLLGTFDKGIYQYKDNTWTHLSSAEKGMPPSAHAFITDKNTKSIWVSSNDGIIQMPLEQLLKKNINETSHVAFGLFTNFGTGISTEFNGSSNISSAILSDTCFAFANAKGLVIFNPQKIISPPLPLNVLVEPVNESSKDPLFNPDSSLYDLQFRPVVPYFGNRGDLEVLYRLTNTDNGWHKLIPNSFINYNNLSPGNHKLQFSLRHYNDVEGKAVLITAKDFTVPYRWYQTIWFKIIAALLLLLMLVTLHYIRIWYILKNKKQLRQSVNQKTKELQEINENLVEVIRELSASEANLKQSNFLKEEYYAVLTHDLRSPLKFLSFNISQLLSQLPGNDNGSLKKGLFAAYECSNEVHKLIEEFVCWIQDNENQLKINPKKIRINEVIEEVKKVYDLAINGNKNVLTASVQDDVYFTTDPKLLFVILRNAIDNANKYTHNGTIHISAAVNEQLELSVSDTGRGMNAELVHELTELQQQGQLRYKQRKSLGFYIMCILTQKLGGSYRIASIKDSGTTVYFQFPLLKEGIM